MSAEPGASAVDEDIPIPSVGLILLAAGASRRMAGQSKQLLIYEGESLVRRAAKTALASLCRPVIVVTGANREKIEAKIADLPLYIVANEDWETGMASSIRTGIEHLIVTAETSATVVMLCDQPLVDEMLINRLIDKYRTTGAPLVAAKYNETHGVPALFDKRLYPSLLALTGLQGAKIIIIDHSADLAEIPVPAAAFDIDTLADYVQLVDNQRSW